MITVNEHQRLTAHKIYIMKFLKSTKSHPTADEVYDNVKHNLPSISRGTVYRNLNQMVDNNQIRKLEINNEFHFDAEKENHIHLLCKKCKKIIDIYDNKSANSILKKSRKHGYSVDSVDIILYGLCKNCSAKK